MQAESKGVSLRLAQSNEKPAIATLLKQHLEELGPWGYGEGYPLDSYWREAKHWPYFIESDGCRAGFVLVNAESISGYRVDATIAEFFILPEFRRKRLGLQAALATFRTRPGQWELSFHKDNRRARMFWRKAIELGGGRSLEAFELSTTRILRFRMVR